MTNIKRSIQKEKLKHLRQVKDETDILEIVFFKLNTKKIFWKLKENEGKNPDLIWLYTL